MRATLSFFAGVVVVAAGACGHEETPAEREARIQAARADSVAQAEAVYDPTAFDTIRWASAEERIERGSVVWTYSCRKCHGPGGRGSGQFAVENGLEVPSLVAPDWPSAGDLPAIRHGIFVGHETGMPHWGLRGLKNRDIDAVAYYLDAVLRPAAVPKK